MSFTIYALTLRGVVVYVGQTRARPATRLNSHRHYSKFAFDNWHEIAMCEDQDEADRIETKAIHDNFSPALKNKRIGRVGGFLPGRAPNFRTGCGCKQCHPK